jgi:hypothetical protein
MMGSGGDLRLGAGGRDGGLDRLSASTCGGGSGAAIPSAVCWALPPPDHPAQRTLIGASDLYERALRLA